MHYVGGKNGVFKEGTVIGVGVMSIAVTVAGSPGFPQVFHAKGSGGDSEAPALQLKAACMSESPSVNM